MDRKIKIPALRLLICKIAEITVAQLRKEISDKSVTHGKVTLGRECVLAGVAIVVAKRHDQTQLGEKVFISSYNL